MKSFLEEWKQRFPRRWKGQIPVRIKAVRDVLPFESSLMDEDFVLRKGTECRTVVTPSIQLYAIIRENGKTMLLQEHEYEIIESDKI